MKTVLIGAGYRGRALAGLLRGMPFFELTAVADPLLGGSPVAGSSVGGSPVKNCQNRQTPPAFEVGGPLKSAENAGAPSRTGAEATSPANPFAGLRVYSGGPEDYRRMLAEERPELVFICSPWDCHIPQALDCLKAGCHVALEIRGGRELGEYEPLMAFPGKVFPLENLIFRRDILAVREMVRAGLFGEIVSLRGGYRHDLRGELVDAEGVLGGNAPSEAPAGPAAAVSGTPADPAAAVFGTPASPLRERPSECWRGRLYTTENADIYPTHGMAPLCLIAGIHSLASVTAFASKAAGLKDRLGEGCPAVTLGDIVNTVARTADGTLLSLVHDTTLPRPKSFGFEVQGTRGIWDEENHRIYIEGRSPFEQWEPDAAYIDEYQDPMWRRWGAEAAAADHHHGGMDWMMLKAIEEDLRASAASSGASAPSASASIGSIAPSAAPERSASSAGASASSAATSTAQPASAGFTYPATLADLALWTSITPLSARSIAEGRTVIL